MWINHSLFLTVIHAKTDNFNFISFFKCIFSCQRSKYLCWVIKGFSHICIQRTAKLSLREDIRYDSADWNTELYCNSYTDEKWTYLGLFPSVKFLFSNIKTTSFVCFLCENCQIANSLTLSCTHCLLIPHLLIKKEIAIKWQYKISINDNIASFVHSWKPWLDILPLCFPVRVRRNELRGHTVSSSVALVLPS